MSKNFLLGQFIERNLPVWLITVGVCLRVKHFFDNRSLWLDEAYVGIHIRIQGWLDLLLNRPCLENSPIPPPGFMILEKIAVVFGGDSEYALRFFPLVFGCAGIVVFYKLAQRILSRETAVFALSLFVFSDTLIYFSAEAKQYSLELLTVVVFWLFVIIPGFDKNWKSGFWRPALLGGLAVVCSHQITFVMAGYVVIRAAWLTRQKDHRQTLRFFLMCFLWAAVWMVLFASSYTHMLSNRNIIGGAHAAGFLPLGSPVESVIWLWTMLWGLFKDPGGLFYSLIPAVLFFIGGISVWKKDRKLWLLCVVPFVLALVASALRKYLIFGRLVLFFIPPLFVFIAEGARSVSEKAGRGYKHVILCGIAVLVLAAPVKQGYMHFIQGRTREEARELLYFMKENFHESDMIVMNYFGMRPFFYYFGRGEPVEELNVVLVTDGVYIKNRKPHVGVFLNPLYFVPEMNFYIEKNEHPGPQCEIAQGDTAGFPDHDGRRVWLFLFHRYDSRDIILELLEKKGLVLQQEMKQPSAELYIFGKK